MAVKGPEMSRSRKFFGIVFFGSAILVGVAGIANAVPETGRILFPVLALLAAALTWKPPPPPLPRTRPASCTTFLIAIIGSIVAFNTMGEEDWAALKAANPDAYLTQIKAAKGEETWLTALAELRPERHAQVLADREREARERERRLAAERAAAREQQILDYMQTIETQVAAISDFDPAGYTGSVRRIMIAVGMLEGWATVLDAGRRFELTDQQQETREHFRSQLAATQARAFPVLRDAYGPALRQALWDDDISARTIGDGFRVVEFVGALFAANRNKRVFHETVRDNLRALRFREARYRWYRGASEYTYWRMDPPSDREVVVRTTVGHRVVE
jgi:hypothetical protein